MTTVVCINAAASARTNFRHGSLIARALWPLLCIWSALAIGVENDIASGRRHPLEIEALTLPLKVLEKLPAVRAAVPPTNHEELARLGLAEANACRVIANWYCQRRAGLAAMTEADLTSSIYLQVRARISAGRAQASLGDFNAASRAFAQAQQRLGDAKENQLYPDIMLAYSSVSFNLGKIEDSFRYASDALSFTPGSSQPEMRIRLLRNMSRAASKMGKPADASVLLQQATLLLQKVTDPKLAAEIFVEQARTARLLNDPAAVESMGEKITALANSLKNSQLAGLGIETTGQALQMRGKRAEAIAAFQRASEAYAALNLYADELRAVRAAVELRLQDAGSNDLTKYVVRLNQLQDKVRAIERDSASSDFEERLRYAQSDADIATANALAETERLRAEYNENKFRYTLLAIVMALILLAVVVGMYWLQRRHADGVRRQNREMEQVLMQTSHDLRNPLNGILGISDWLLSTPLPADQKNKIQAIRDAGTSLASLAQDLLDRGRLKGGNLTIHPEVTDLNRLIKNLGALYQPLANKKNLGLRVQVGEGLPGFVSIDAHRLQQVLGNLFGNALKFTDHGDITLEVVETKDASQENSASIRFQVRDSGPGIAKADQARLFQPFEKGDFSRKNSTGAGLGLAISKDLVRLMGGKLEVASEQNEGAAFFFTLKLPVMHEPATTEAHHGAGEEPAGDMSAPMRVLAVDDEEVSLMLLGHQVGALGHTVETCETPMAALAAVGNSAFDVVLMDYEMTGMKGPELAAKIRARDAAVGSAPRLIMISGHPPDSAADVVDDWLVKPVNLDRLRRALDRRQWRQKSAPAAETRAPAAATA